jgi:hypothetical protein
MVPRKPASKSNVEVAKPDEWRFKWIERDIKAIQENHEKLCETVDKIDPRVRRIEIIGYIIIALGITSKVFSAEIADLLKAVIGI